MGTDHTFPVPSINHQLSTINFPSPSRMKIAIIDYGGGNLQSVRNALRRTGSEAEYANTPEALHAADLLVFPGQGEFGDTMAALRRQGLADPLREWIAADRPFLGICVGYQALFEGSEENPAAKGLAVFPGVVRKFTPGSGLKVPHMGWNRVRLTDPADPAWAGLEPDPHFYFVHSYYPDPADASLVAGVTDYGGEFACAIRRGNLTATQFHPEKSQDAGLTLLRNFVLSHTPAAVG